MSDSASDVLPLRLYAVEVPLEWIDYNGHMNDSRYMQLCSQAGDRFLDAIGMDADYLASGRSFFTVEAHLSYAQQCLLGDELYVTGQLLDHDRKRVRLFTEIFRATDDSQVATGEFMMLHVDTALGKATAMGDEVFATLQHIADVHRLLPTPALAGRGIGQPRS